MYLQEWRFVAASALGTSHSKSQTPCQDSHACELIGTECKVLIFIASDGAGSAVHSDLGSSLACQELLENIKLYFHDGNKASEITREIALGWLEHASCRISHKAEQMTSPIREFACTLLAAIVTDNHAVFMQVGDGAIVVRPRGDEWCHIFWPQHGEFINTTVFITDPTALSQFEFCSRADFIDELSVFTDGIESLVLSYAEKCVHSPFFDGVFPAVRALPELGYDEILSKKLEDYLNSAVICNRTDDDKTLLLASRLIRPPSRALTVI